MYVISHFKFNKQIPHCIFYNLGLIHCVFDISYSSIREVFRVRGYRWLLLMCLRLLVTITMKVSLYKWFSVNIKQSTQNSMFLKQ